jgi:hypothetical protein
MDWIICQQLPRGNTVQYQTSEMEQEGYFEYYEFLRFLQSNFFIKDFWSFKNSFDSFDKIAVLRDGSWQIEEIPKEEFDKFTMPQLLKINENKRPSKQELDKQAAEQRQDSFMQKLRQRLSKFDPGYLMKKNVKDPKGRGWDKKGKGLKFDL